jgi:hypothetical protein
MLLITDDPDKLVQVQLALDDTNKAANNSYFRIYGLHKRLEFLPTDLEARSITGGPPQPKNTGGKAESGMESGSDAKDRRTGQGERGREGQPREGSGQPCTRG